jgi:hypothetical protein
MQNTGFFTIIIFFSITFHSQCMVILTHSVLNRVKYKKAVYPIYNVISIGICEDVMLPHF